MPEVLGGVGPLICSPISPRSGASEPGDPHAADQRFERRQDDGSLLTERHLGDNGFNGVLVAVQPSADGPRSAVRRL